MTNYDNVLGSLARGGPGAVRYDGDSLTNDAEHQYRIDLAAMLEQETELIKFPDNVGSGATIGAAEEKINELRSMLLKTADGLRTIGEAAKKAAPPIRTGTAADPEVQQALRDSSAAYASVKDIVPPDSADHVIEGGHGPAPGAGSPKAPTPGDNGPAPEVSPTTQVSSAAPQGQAPAAGGPAQAPAQAAAGMPQGAPGAPMAGGPAAGMPATAPSGYSPGTGGGAAGGPQNKPRRRESEPGPTTYGSSANGPEVGGVMPVVNPSVTGGRVDPAQISGRTASTSPSAGLPPLKTGPAGSTGMMGGMGGMPLGGGGPHGGGGAGGGRPNMPQPKRDRESERILTGQEARDKALVSHILRDDDPPAGEYIDSADLLADVFPIDRHPAPPQYAEPAAPTTPAPQPIVNTAPLTEPTGPLREPVPPAASGRGAAPIQHPGEPRDDELW